MSGYMCFIKLCSCFFSLFVLFICDLLRTYAGMITVLCCVGPWTWTTCVNVTMVWGKITMGVSENSGNPKSSILIGFSIINHPFWGTPIFRNTLITSSKKGLIRPRCLWHVPWPFLQLMTFPAGAESTEVVSVQESFPQSCSIYQVG